MFDEELFKKLLEDYFDESLGGDDRARFEQMLCSGERARKLFWHAASQHALAREWGPNLAGGETAVHLEDAGNVVEGNFRKRNLAVWGACAAAVVLSLFVWKWSTRAPGARDAAVAVGEAPVAILAVSEDAVWAGARSGRDLRPGEMKLESGIVRIDFYSGARAWVQGPANFSLVSEMEMDLSEGRMKVKVAPAARGFSVKTRELVAVDLGTEFGVLAEDAGRTEVHVFSGRVEVARPVRGSEATMLTTGEGLKFSDGELVAIAADVTAFPDPEMIFRQREVERQNEYSGMVAARDSLSGAPGTLLHYVFPKAEGGTVPNVATGADVETNGTIIGGHWGAGRWPGTKALELNGMSDRVRLYLPGSLPQVTFMTWVRIDSLPRRLAAIWRVEDERPGCPHLNVDSQGRFRMGIHGNKAEFKAPDSRSLGYWDVAASEPCLVGREGKWVHLAAVYDSSDGSVLLYCDGEPVGSHRINDALPVRFGVSQIGSSLIGQDADYWGTSRETLTGAIDEFSVSSRKFSGEEIRRWYEAGKVR